MAEKQEEINDDTPIEQVRLTVPITDDPTLHVLTFRTWVVGSILCILLAFVQQYLSYSQQFGGIASSCFIILILPVGRLMAAILPTKTIRVPMTKWTLSMNPGPFNVKEHVLLSTLAISGLNSPYATVVVYVAKVFYHKSFNFWAGFLMIQTSQMLGYGFSGIFKKFLVNSPYMWWPYTVMDVAFYRTLHEVEVRPKGHLTKFQFFLIASVSSFAYCVIPNYFFPSISALSFVCWIWKHSVTAQQIGSGFYGLGIGSFSFDWGSVTAFLGTPLALPMSAIINIMLGFVLCICILAPITYWSNSYSLKKIPFYSWDLFDSNGHIYNVSQILDDNLRFDKQAYKGYSKIFLSTITLYNYGFNFAAITSTLSHFVIHHGREILVQSMQAFKSRDQYNDIHNRLMRKYDTIPQWWFYAILFSMMGISITICEIFRDQLQLPYWGILLACLLVLILLLPNSVLTATTGMSVEMSLITEMILGYVYPGKPIANLVFKSYGLSAMFNATRFIKEFKLAHYMKIPPKSLFIIQIVGTFIGSTVSYCTSWWLLTTVNNICDLDKLPKGSKWTCPGEHVAYSSTLIWGAVGPSNVFAPHGLYSIIYIFFLVGLVAPVIVWMLTRVFPEKKWLSLINVPLILYGPSVMPPAGAVHYWSWFALGVLFNFIVYNNYKGWWAKYNYILSYGLDIGVAFMALLNQFSLQNFDIYGINWWGLSYDDHCPIATCPTAPNMKVEGCPVFN